MASTANIGETKNIMMVVPLNPVRLVCHEKYLKEGLKRADIGGQFLLCYLFRTKQKDQPARKRRGATFNAIYYLIKLSFQSDLKFGAEARSRPRQARLTQA